MSLRRFEAASTPEALGAVRAALGPEAIILSNRQVNGRVEIIATGVIDEALLALASDVPTPASRPVPPEMPAMAAAVASAPTEASAAQAPAPASSRATRPVPGLVRGVQVSPLPPPAAPGAASPGRSVRRSGTSRRRDSEGAPAKRSRPPVRIERAGVPAPSHAVEAARAAPVATPVSIAPTPSPAPSPEANGIERVEARLRRLEIGLWGERDEPRAALLSKLLTLGLGPALALRLAERATGETEEALVRSALAVLTASVPVRRDTTLERPGATLLAGPDAQSRTDVLMKFATRQVATSGAASLLLVSVDDERHGAFETLEAHGHELGVATVRARSVADIARTVDSFSDRPLVLVDTGRSLPDVDVPVRVASAPRRLVVLPATLQRGVVERVARDARAAHADGCVLSGLDAAARLGETLDALVRESLPIAWWSDSDAPHVPLQRASGSVIVATAVAMAKKLGRHDDDIALATLLQPRAPRTGPGFAGAVNLGGCASPATNEGA